MRQLELIISSPLCSRRQSVSLPQLREFPYLSDGWRIQQVSCSQPDSLRVIVLINRCQLVDADGVPDLDALDYLEQLSSADLKILYFRLLYQPEPVPDFWAVLSDNG